MRISIDFSEEQKDKMTEVIGALMVFGISCKIRPIKPGQVILGDSSTPIANVTFYCSKRDWLMVLKEIE